jgi:hypothetical protein
MKVVSTTGNLKKPGTFRNSQCTNFLEYADADVETEFVAFDRRGWSRVLERIAADLDILSLVANNPHATKNQTTMILEHVIATSWPSRHRSRRS